MLGIVIIGAKTKILPPAHHELTIIFNSTRDYRYLFPWLFNLVNNAYPHCRSTFLVLARDRYRTNSSHVTILSFKNGNNPLDTRSKPSYRALEHTLYRANGSLERKVMEWLDDRGR